MYPEGGNPGVTSRNYESPKGELDETHFVALSYPTETLAMLCIVNLLVTDRHLVKDFFIFGDR